MLWIPFFPFAKLWVMQQGDQTYKVSPQAEAMFNRLYTSERTPWYSFAGWIILAVIGVVYFFNNKAESNRRMAERESYLAQQADARLTAFQNPQVGDVYELDGSQPFGARVTAVTPDSIEFEFTEGQSGNFEVSRTLARLDHDDIHPRRLQRFSRTDLTNSARLEEATAAAGTLQFGEVRDLQVKNVLREYPKNYTVSDQELTEQLRRRFTEFLDQGDLDLKMSMLNRSSLEYLTGLLAAARSEDNQQLRAWIDRQSYPAAAYYLALQTKFHFLPTMAGTSPEEDLQNLMLYLTLMDLPILTLDREKLELKETAYLTGPATGKVYVERPYNLIEGFGSETFQVEMTRENNQWLIDLPSSFRFYQSQIQKTAGNRSDSERGWRAKVRTDLNELTEGSVTLPAELNY